MSSEKNLADELTQALMDDEVDSSYTGEYFFPTEEAPTEDYESPVIRDTDDSSGNVNPVGPVIRDTHEAGERRDESSEKDPKRNWTILLGAVGGLIIVICLAMGINYFSQKSSSEPLLAAAVPPTPTEPPLEEVVIPDRVVDPLRPAAIVFADGDPLSLETSSTSAPEQMPVVLEEEPEAEISQVPAQPPMAPDEENLAPNPTGCKFINGKRPKVDMKYIVRCDDGVNYLASAKYENYSYTFYDYEDYYPDSP